MTVPPPRGQPGVRAYAYLFGVLWLLPLLLVGAGTLLLPDVNADGQCEGIGFGCSLTPSDGVQFLVLLAAPLLLVGGVAGALLLAVLRTQPAFARTAPVLQALAVLTVLALVTVVLAALA
ncbi:hypothetical protein [Blastococcus sp. LR1]|uniref:hypothetical protein n=1 Tax=Blastococcus sp. LR1 TaxID=2877000 RepID=UPI001CCBDF1B|nr:hypothetical protein [Blastococcus sp. LR1]MCA0146461.1 hypothetical protein [Blastococcus sp. LR1]